MCIRDRYAEETLEAIKNVDGVKDPGIIKNIGQPEISVELDRDKMAMFGVTLTDAQAVLETAFGGVTASTLYDGERKFDIRIRYEQEYRKDENDLALLMVPTPVSYTHLDVYKRQHCISDYSAVTSFRILLSKNGRNERQLALVGCD